jgi:Protein of unknown function (DUF993)
VTTSIRLPAADGSTEDYELNEPVGWIRPAGPATTRSAYAAAHVVARAHGDNARGRPADLDWDATMAVRHALWDWGLGVAEAMDTAQRGMGLDWATCRELVRRTAREADRRGARIVAGAVTDQGRPARDLADVIAAYREQIEFLTDLGVTPVIMASRDLVRLADAAGDYRKVYDAVLSGLSGPVLLHWLGDMFDPALHGYWGSADLDVAVPAFVELVSDHSDVVHGVKVSLLDEMREVQLRRLLLPSVAVYTGDDFHYPELILGDGEHHSHALLGAFSAIAPAAATALHRLDGGDEAGFLSVLEPTVPLSRHLFGPPTQFYKTGIAFLAWLNGTQPGFTMVDGLQSGRSVLHLVEAFRLADRAGVLLDPDLAAARMSAFLTVAGLPA